MKTPEGVPSESSVIRLMEDREIIEKKLAEYRKRLNLPQFYDDAAQIDTIYKIAIAEKLVETGEVNKEDIFLEVADKHKIRVRNKFDVAWRVISDYVKTGGEHNHGGTGLDRNKDMGEPDDGDGRIM